MKTILSIQSQVAGALVGNSVAAFAIERLGVRVLALPTVLMGRRPDRGAPGGGAVEKEKLAALFAALKDDGWLPKVDAVLSGYLGAEDHVEFVLDAVDSVKSANAAAFYVCDPVMGDEGHGLFVKEPLAQAIVEGLVRQADWIAPNLFEFSRIAGRELKDLEDIRTAARRLGKPALVSSIPRDKGIGVLFATPNGDWLAETPKLPNAPKGTGDLLTALFLARRVKGETPPVALGASAGAVHDIIVRSLARESDHLALPEAQDLLADPQTWPQAQSLGK
ncbi:MAG: pyridoxal kinase [Hyphomonadaceae bacterium]